MRIELRNEAGAVLAVAEKDDLALEHPVTLEPGRYFIVMDGVAPMGTNIDRATTVTRFIKAEQPVGPLPSWPFAVTPPA